MQRIFDKSAWWERLANRGASISVALLCLVLGTALWVGLLQRFSLEHDLITASEHQGREYLAAVLEQHVARSLRSAETTLRQMRSAYRRGGARFDLRQYAARVGALAGPYYSLGIVDDKGAVVLSTTPLPAAAFNAGNSEALQTLRDENSSALYIGKPSLDDVTKKLSLILGLRIDKADGSFGGYAALVVDPDYFTSIFNGVPLGTDAVFSVVGRDGIVRARSTANGVSAGENLTDSPAFFGLLLKSDRGSFVQKSVVDGVTRIFSFHGLRDVPLIVLVGASAEEALSDLRAHQRFDVVAAVSVSLLLLGLSLLALLQIARTQRASEALRTSEERFKLAAEASSDGIWDWNVVEGVSFVSDRLYQLLGYTRDGFDLSVETWIAHLHPNDKDVVLASMRRHLKARVPYNLEYRLRTKSGAYHWFHASGLAAWDAAGRPLRMVGSLCDVTERVQAEAELRASRQRLADAERIAQLGNWELDLGENRLSWSDEIFRIFEIDRARFGASYEAFLEAIHPLDRAAVNTAFEHSVESRQPYEIVHRLLMGDGRVKHVRERGVTEYGADGGPLRIRGTVQDITSLVLAEEATRRQRDFAESLITTAPAMILVLDLKGRIQHINPYMEQMSGYRLDEVRGKDWFSTFLTERDREPMRSLFHVVSAAASTQGNVISIVTRQGVERTVEWYDRQLLDGDGRLTGVLAIGLDITERRRAEEALRTSEGRLRRAEALSRVGHYAFAADGSEAVWSDGLKAMWGFAQDTEPPFEELAVRIHPDDSAWVMKAFAEAGQEGRDFDLEYRIIRPDGSVITVHSLGEMTTDQHSGMPRYIGSMADITEHTRAEQALKALNEELEDRIAMRTADLRASEARFRVLVEAMNEGLGQVDPQGRITYVNSSLCRMIGYTREELTGRFALEMFDSRAKEELLQRMDKRAQGNIDPYEITMPHKEGHSIEVYVSPIALRDNDGNFMGSAAVFLDMTALRQAERELAASRDRLQYLLSASPAVLYAATALGATFVSDNVGQLLGYNPEALLHNPDFLRQNIHPQDLEQVLSGQMRLAQGSQVSQQYRIRAADGQWRWLRDSSRAMLSDDGSVREVVGLWQDVTELVAAETELSQMRDKLLVSQKMATIGQLTATVSHELRNPLGTIRTSVSTLSQRYAQTDAMLARTLERIERNVVRCDNIVTDLLDFSRTRESRSEPTRIASWLQEVVADIARPEWLQIEYDLNAAGMVVALDQDRFRRAVINVVENAIQAMEPDAANGAAAAPARLAIGCRAAQGKLVVTVTDSGLGMTPETLTRAFEPLFSTKTYGVGLGLATVKQIMLQERGDIQITSQPQQGTQVTLWLPLSPVAEGAMA